MTIEVAFGGQLGYNTGTNQSAIAATSSGDTALTTADAWAVELLAVHGRRLGDRQRHERHRPGTFDRTGNFLRDPFTYALPRPATRPTTSATSTRSRSRRARRSSLAHFVVTGLSRDARARRRRHHARRRHAGRARSPPRPPRSPPRRRSPTSRRPRRARWRTGIVGRQLRRRAAPRARPGRRRHVDRRHHELAVQRRGQVDHAARRPTWRPAPRTRSRSCAPTWTGSPPTTAARSACTR